MIHTKSSVATTRRMQVLLGTCACTVSLLLLTACDPPDENSGASKTARAQPAPQPSTPTKPAMPAKPLPPERSGGPMLHMLQPTIDFGKMSDLDVKTAKITFINNGDRVLEIVRVQPTCGCTTTTLDRKLFGPGEGDVIDLTFKPTAGGKQTKIVKVHTNDAVNPVQTISISADVKGTVTVNPRSLSFGVVPLNVGSVGSVVLTAESPNYKPGKTTVFGQLKEYATVHTTETTNPGDANPSWRIDVVLNPQIPWGWHTGSLQVAGTVSADGERKVTQKSTTVGMNASIQGDLRANDTMFRLLILDQNRPIQKTIRLFHSRETPFQILDAQVANSRPEGLTVAVVPIEGSNGSGYEITLMGNTGKTIGPLRGDVEIKTDIPGEENVTLRISGSVRKPDA